VLTKYSSSNSGTLAILV